MLARMGGVMPNQIICFAWLGAQEEYHQINESNIENIFLTFPCSNLYVRVGERVL